MKRTALLLLALLATLLIGVTPALHAQDAPDLPPTIITFTSNVTSITLADAERGNVTATLRWEIIGVVSREHTIALEAYRITGWESMLDPDETALRANGRRDIEITHPNNFGPPTYRLSVSDAQGRILDQRLLVISYDLASITEPARIATFSGDMLVLDATALANGSARVTLTWSVANRTPDTNLVFEQVLDADNVVSVELPRANIWVPSSGTGAVAPVMPAPGQPVRLRIRVVDMVKGSTLAETALDPIEVSANGSQAAPVTVPEQPAPVEEPDSDTAEMPPTDTATAANVNVALFTVAPEIISRGGTVTLTWDVRGAADLSVYLLEPGGPIAGYTDNPADQGTWTVNVPESYVDIATFMLSATDSAGNVHTESLTVNIICPFTYFFGPGIETTCPLDDMRTVQAAYQRFEHGTMVWRGDNSDIYVLFDNGMVNRYKDSWMGGDVTFPDPAPSGLLQPAHGFGTVWVENPQVRVELGWATGFEQGYVMRFQQSGHFKYGRLYFDLPDGSVVYIVENVWHPLGE